MDAVLGDVVKADVIARRGADLGDAAAHLAGADDADPANSVDMVPAWRLRRSVFTSAIIAARRRVVLDRIATKLDRNPPRSVSFSARPLFAGQQR